MTPTERLRAAAEKIRRTDYWAEWQDPWWTPEGLAGLEMAEPDAQHIALWSPPVALAVADWLDVWSEHVAAYECEAECPPGGCESTHRALALADLILGAGTGTPGPIDAEVIAGVLLDHRDSGVTTVTEGCGDDEHITGASAWCYCGGTGPGLDWMTRGPAWRGTFNLPGDGAERELRQHIAEAVEAALRGES